MDLTFHLPLQLAPLAKAVREEIKVFVEDLELGPKRYARASTLSGGQRRALSVAVAFAGRSTVVILVILLGATISGDDPDCFFFYLPRFRMSRALGWTHRRLVVRGTLAVDSDSHDPIHPLISAVKHGT